ncbi:MAG: hypothetical protein IJA59_07850 [Clostridia bacterium]|nr:hypothetical protein [Clostridia bacterium]
MQFTLRIKKRGQNETMVLLMLAIVFSFGLLLDLLNFPELFKYTADVVWLGLLVTIAINHFRMPNKETASLLTLVMVFWVFTLFGFIINSKSPLYYLWGFRNNFRYFIYFFACCMFLRAQNVAEIMKIFDKLFYVNFAVSIFQFFVLGKKMDYLGGIFGTSVGCNGKTIIFFSIVLARSILNYINGKETTKTCLMKCGMALVIAALAELRFFFILFVLIVAMALLITRTSIKKLWIVIAASVGVYVGAMLLVAIFPRFRGFLNISNIVEVATSSSGYTGRGDMNRLTAIPIVWDRFLKNWPERLLGLGLGNCDTSAFSFLNTAFFEQHGHLHYNWFSSSFMFLETGIIGLGLYMLFFAGVYVYTRKREKNGEAQRDICQLVRILAPVCLLMIIYNVSMRAEEAYIMYFVLALPFINKKQRQRSLNG